MPKLGNGGYGEKFGYVIDKSDDEVAFSDQQHVYFSLKDGHHYDSVTSILKQYEQPFDESL